MIEAQTLMRINELRNRVALVERVIADGRAANENLTAVHGKYNHSAIIAQMLSDNVAELDQWNEKLETLRNDLAELEEEVSA